MNYARGATTRNLLCRPPLISLWPALAYLGTLVRCLKVRYSTSGNKKEAGIKVVNIDKSS